MGSPGGPAYGKPSTSEADDWLRAQGWPLGAATYETYQAGAPLTPPQNQAPRSGPAGDGSSVADGSTSPPHTEPPWPVGPGVAAVLALSLYVLIRHVFRRWQDPMIIIAALFCLIPAATYPLLMLYGVTLSRQLTADIILTMAAINSALTLLAILLIPGTRPPREPTPLNWAKFLKALAIVIGIPVGLYLILSWKPEIIHYGCRGNVRCQLAEGLIGSRREAFSTIWLMTALLQVPLVLLCPLSWLLVTQYIPSLWRR